MQPGVTIREASFAMDDPLRDDELAIAGAWAHVPGFEIHGVVPVDKALWLDAQAGLLVFPHR
jgi:hypothetical protein